MYVVRSVPDSELKRRTELGIHPSVRLEHLPLPARSLNIAGFCAVKVEYSVSRSLKLRK